MKLNELKTALDGGSPSIDNIINLMNITDEMSPLRQTKDDALTLERIFEMEKYLELGSNVIPFNHILKITEAEYKAENRIKIGDYLSKLTEYIEVNNKKIKSYEEEIKAIHDQIKLFKDVYNHISDNGHLTTVITLLDRKDVENEPDLRWVSKADMLKSKILNRYNDKINEITKLIVELDVETNLINEERELIKAYDYDVNYIDFDKQLKYKKNG